MIVDAFKRYVGGRVNSEVEALSFRLTPSTSKSQSKCHLSCKATLTACQSSQSERPLPIHKTACYMAP